MLISKSKFKLKLSHLRRTNSPGGPVDNTRTRCHDDSPEPGTTFESSEPSLQDVEMTNLPNVDNSVTQGLEEMGEAPALNLEDPTEAWQDQITLQDLRTSQDTIEQIRSYSFEHEQMQWTKDEFDTFCNPPQDTWALDDPDFKLSLRIYMALSAHSSEATYEAVRQIIKEHFPASNPLSFDVVRRRLGVITGILPLRFDMCVNSCIAYTGTFAHLEKCTYCGENRYSGEDSESSPPRRQFVTLPLGPQLQALWRHPQSVDKLRDRLRRTACALNQRESPGGILDYEDICCGSEYLDHVESGNILDDDMVLMISMDGAQLYRDKKSDTWFGIATMVDYNPAVRHLKESVLPLFAIGGPNPPKNYDSFLFPTFAHLSACQNRGLSVWDSLVKKRRISYPWFAFGTADTVGMAEMSGSVGHHGRNGCRLLCAMPGRHKAGSGTYYPVMLKPIGDRIPVGASHPSIPIDSIKTPSPEEYDEKLKYVLTSPSARQYESRRRDTGIYKPSIVSALPKSFPVPKCFPADTMHLFGLNLAQLLISLWRGTIDHSKDDAPSSWEFAVLSDDDTWKAHGSAVAAAGRYIPVCLVGRLPRNPAEKISSGYKAIEFLVYVFGLCPTLLYGKLPQPYLQHFCKLVFAMRIVHRRHKSKDDLLAAHKALLEFVFQFELLYYAQKPSRLHFVRPCVHALTHTVPEHFRIGSLTEVSQWTMERTIGNLGEEIRLHSDPYANISQRIIERAQVNGLLAFVPELQPKAPELPRRAHDIGGGYALMGPRELHDVDPLIANAFHVFASSHGWRTKSDDSLLVDRFARLLLPNGQIARSWWQEMKRPIEKVRVARNVKVNFIFN